ncbi:MAG TPA: site-specific DNA-methyltransferase [Actinomycetes bacterium]|nr:site-specific DNA-methyltransferase [Actinomycetes bacterium]
MNEVTVADYRDLLAGLASESVDAVITDPPFGIGYVNHYTHTRHASVIGDDAPFSYAELARHAYRVLKPDTAFLAFTDWQSYPGHFHDVAAAGFKMKEPLICQKRPAGTADLYGAFQSNADWILFAHKGRFVFRETQLLRNKRAGTVPNVGRNPVPEYKRRFPSCWFGPEFPSGSENPASLLSRAYPHPTVKTLQLLQWLIALTTDLGGIVVDPFVGTGTTAVAAAQCGRNFIAGDVSPACVAMASRRLVAPVG